MTTVLLALLLLFLASKLVVRGVRTYRAETAERKAGAADETAAAAGAGDGDGDAHAPEGRPLQHMASLRSTICKGMLVLACIMLGSGQD